MACRLFGTKPLPEPIVVYCQLDSLEQVSVKFEFEFIIFIQENAFENVVCRNGGHGGHFVQVEMARFLRQYLGPAAQRLIECWLLHILTKPGRSPVPSSKSDELSNLVIP